MDWAIILLSAIALLLFFVAGILNDILTKISDLRDTIAQWDVDKGLAELKKKEEEGNQKILEAKRKILRNAFYQSVPKVIEKES